MSSQTIHNTFRRKTQASLSLPFSSNPSPPDMESLTVHNFSDRSEMESPSSHGDKTWTEDDVQTDVLFPHFPSGSNDKVDLAAFDEMVEEQTRKPSIATLKLSRSISKQGQLYGESGKV